ncbi:hypothetical protein BGW80DRAFT_1463528 [Lactifluus volemus]|nr:hypothetical protein BGW80DRAFT_1463528 [Lactifluus volemus]
MPDTQPIIGDSWRDNVKVSTQSLWCDTTQAQAIKRLHDEGLVIRQTFSDSTTSQTSANDVLSRNGLDEGSLKQLERRWMKVWSLNWQSKKGKAKCILFQCSCGYNTEARQEAKQNKSHQLTTTQCAPYDFTRCLAHADVTYEVSSGWIGWIIGYFEHNFGCQTGIMKRLPPVPLHSHVFEVALEQLEEGANITAIQRRNLDMCHRQEYRNQRSTHPSQANYRFNFQKTDFKQLYVLHYRSQGINISKHAEDNVHDWLNPHSPNFNIDIAKSVFHYSARVQHSDRFEAFISTKEMEDAAWSYVHNSQLILDGTFGVSSSRLLLWIAMGLDHQGKGLPVAMFLFSAPAGVLLGVQPRKAQVERRFVVTRHMTRDADTHRLSAFSTKSISLSPYSLTPLEFDLIFTFTD